MKDKKRLIIAISAMVIILVITVLLVIKLISINKNKENEIVEENNNIKIDNNELEENVIENKVNENEQLNNIENNESPSGTEVNGENNQSTPVADPEQEVDKQTIQKQETDKEKAINIAKKDWGTDNSVYFSFEGTNNGKSIVSVRSNDTTRALRYYYININNGTFEIEE